MQELNQLADFLFEADILRRLPRSGFTFLGDGKESVAEHSFLTAIIGMTLARICPDIDGAKLMTMCLIHDLPEARTGDMNYVNKEYTQTDETKAMRDCFGPLPFGEDLTGLIEEFNAGETTEAQLARDADQIALLIVIKYLLDTGCQPAETWIEAIPQRLVTDMGRQLAQSVLETHKDHWWLKDLRQRSRQTIDTRGVNK